MIAGTENLVNAATITLWFGVIGTLIGIFATIYSLYLNWKQAKVSEQMKYMTDVMVNNTQYLHDIRTILIKKLK